MFINPALIAINDSGSTILESCRPIDAQYSICCAALRCKVAPARLAASIKDCSIRTGDELLAMTTPLNTNVLKRELRPHCSRLLQKIKPVCSNLLQTISFSVFQKQPTQWQK